MGTNLLRLGYAPLHTPLTSIGHDGLNKAGKLVLMNLCVGRS